MAVYNAGIAQLHSNTLSLLHIFMVSFFLSLKIPSANSSLSFSFNNFDPNGHQIHFEEQASYSGDKAIHLTRNQNFSYGDGLGFFLAPNGTQLPLDVTGGSGLGLVSNNQQALNSTGNHFFIVEFDTFPNAWDPKHDHVGININSMKFVENMTWLSHILE
ncbi:hypothetical protein PVL29_003568 [Vitis rotundifolia]|uniref:Legume lectin domain-containing protein n=1 Tax=Vitis rotundifolia TaxID=103349 RepID=A0AA39E5A4_VITRO|nr:hypothetical protein PVL29_003562 [Vitis rotundifolia]KAJ9705568.1 hypothetical protein PVL29_003568 [Vitis rotundifolia]